MLDQRVLRFGGAMAMAGAVLGLIFNLLHPRGDAAVFDDAAAEVAVVSTTDMWSLIHYMLAISVLLGLLALLVVGRSFRTEPAASWGLLAGGIGIASSAVLFVAVVLDGFAMERLTDGSAGAAEAVHAVIWATFTGGIATYFGLTPMLFGIAMVSGADYPRWLGYLALAGGGLGFVTGTIQWFTGPTSFTMNVLFLIASLVVTIWFLLTGRELWRRAGAAMQPASHTVAPPPVA
jgi:hypothetical protein